MSKPALRFLSLGFLISAIVLTGYRFFLYEPQLTAKDPVSIETTEPSKEELSYKKKYEELLAETEVTELTKENSASSDSTTDAKSDESVEPDIIEATIVISDGDPSSIPVQQLKNQGIITNSTEFETFLDENNYITLLRPGTYEVSNNMTFQEIADILMGD